MLTPEQKRIYNAARRKAAIEAGKCHLCFKHDPVPGKVHCDTCLEFYRYRGRVRYRQLLKKQGRTLGDRNVGRKPKEDAS